MNTRYFMVAVVILGLFCIQAHAADEVLIEERLNNMRSYMENSQLSEKAMRGIFDFMPPIFGGKCRDCLNGVFDQGLSIGNIYSEKCRQCVNVFFGPEKKPSKDE